MPVALAIHRSPGLTGIARSQRAGRNDFPASNDGLRAGRQEPDEFAERVQADCRVPERHLRCNSSPSQKRSISKADS